MTVTTTLLARSASSEGLPLEMHWTGPHGVQPVPMRLLRSPRSRPRTLPAIYHPELRHANADPGVPFDFTRYMRRLCGDIVSRCSCFHHINMDRVLVSATRARSNRAAGLQAKVTPLRFRGGLLVRRRRGRIYQVQRYWMNGLEVLYLVTFCLPRFLNQSFDDKLITVFHELYHMAPEFDGDLRRHGGRYCIHTHSQKGYDRHMAGLAREYLQAGADPALHAFLRLDFNQLRERHGQIVAAVVPVPKLVPL